MFRSIIFSVTLILLSLKVLQSQTVKDADGNIYFTIIIGKQTWMGENLKTTKYNDGKPIPLVTANEKWNELTTPAYCWYNNDIKNKEIFGALYNWYAVNTKKLCPVGWHVSSDEEWVTLIEFLGGANMAGNKLKETGLSHWKNITLEITNEYDFTALPGGMRYFSGDFPMFGESYAIWWTSTELSPSQARNRGLHNSSSAAFHGSDNKRSGFSVRCIKD